MRIIQILLAAVFLGVPFIAKSDQLTFVDFSNSSALVLNGDTQVVDTTADGQVLRLTAAESWQAGTAFSSQQITASSFSTYFTFRITDPGGIGVADGFVFTIQSVSSDAGGSGGGIGYSGIDSSVGVEFDTYYNYSMSDPQENHIAIDTNGEVTHDASGADVKNISADFSNGEIWHAWVDYDGTTLEVRLSSTGARPSLPDLEKTLDIPSVIGQDTAYIGFTSATGNGWANHDIIYWEYKGFYDPVDIIDFVSGVITSDVNGGLAPVTIEFQTLVSQGTAPFTYEYDFGDGNVQTAATKTESHTYDTTGTFSVQVTVTDAGGLTEVIPLAQDIVVTDTSGVNAYQSSLQNDADQMVQTADANGMTDLLADAQAIVGNTLGAVSNADAATKTSVQSTLQAAVEELVENTAVRLDALIQSGQITAGDYENIAAGLGDVISEMVVNQVPITANTLESAINISETLYAQTLDTALAGKGVTPAEIDALKADPTSNQAFFQTHPHLLDDVLDTSGIPVDTRVEFDAGQVGTVAQNKGLTEQQGALLYNAIETTRGVQFQVADSTGVTAKTIAEIAAQIYETYYGKTLKGYTVESITQNLLLEFTDTSFVSFLIAKVYIKQAFMPNGLFDLPNGNKLGITDDYAMEFTSYPVSTSEFMADVIGMDFIPVLKNDGRLKVVLTSTADLSIRMGWDYAAGNTFNSQTVAFNVTGGTDPGAEAYSLLVTYDTGKSQLMPPSIYAADALTSWLDTLTPGDYSIDADTGVLTVGTLKLKPDYLFQDLTGIDYTGIKASGGFQYGNLALVVNDFNNDGIPDIQFYSDDPMGVQILYTLP